jgi:hypothetical protein
MTAQNGFEDCNDLLLGIQPWTDATARSVRGLDRRQVSFLNQGDRKRECLRNKYKYIRVYVQWIDIFTFRTNPAALLQLQASHPRCRKVVTMKGKQSTDAGLTPVQRLLNDLWDEHLRDEFATKGAPDALDTMVPDAPRT